MNMCVFFNEINELVFLISTHKNACVSDQNEIHTVIVNYIK